jgi:fucose 4-O-acetylase-like acetyltransferase
MYNLAGNRQQATGHSFIVDEELSKRIKSLRFLLIVFVVFIHNNVTEVDFSSKTEIYEIPFYVEKIRYLISGIITRVSVPLFFFISGFLLYAKKTEYVTTLKKKCRTILIPYTIWNILAVVFYFTAQSFSFTKPYFVNNIIRNFEIIDWIDIFIGKFTELRGYQYPLVYPFWFLRDLFILYLLYKLIKKLVDLFPFGTFVILCLLWLNNIKFYIVSNEALLYFTCGYYVVKYSLNYRTLDNLRLFDVLMAYIVTIIIELFFYEYVPTIHKINVIVGSIVFIKLTHYFIQNIKMNSMLIWLEEYAFFVYAIHEPCLTIMKKLSVRIIPMRGGFILLQYFGVVFLGILIFLCTGIILKKLFPKLYSILTGGRL